MGLVQTDKILISNSLTDIIANQNLVTAAYVFGRLIEQLQPLDAIIKITAVDQVWEFSEFAPTKAVYDVIQLTMPRSEWQATRIAHPLTLYPYTHHPLTYFFPQN